MSIEISDKIKKAIILSMKDEFTEEDYPVIDDSIEQIKSSEEYQIFDLLYERNGYEQILKNREYNKGFVSRLLFNYHEPIIELEIFIENCLSIINEFNYEESIEANLYTAIDGIAARAMLISQEILLLVKNGFSSGALARWRTLYELSIIATFLAKYGENTAQRYLAYQDVSTYNEAKLYNKYVGTLGFEEIKKEEFNELQLRYENIKRQFPEINDGDYSWASHILGMASFKKIAENTDLNYLLPFYKLSCNYNHGNAKAIFFDIGQLYGLSKEQSYKLAQTNVGFTDTAQLTALSLLSVVKALISLNPNMENLGRIIYLQDKITKLATLFDEVSKRIENEEQEKVCRVG